MELEELVARKRKLEEERERIAAQFNYMNGQIAGQIALIDELIAAQSAKQR